MAEKIQSKRYHFNLIAKTRLAERKEQKNHSITRTVGSVSLGILLLTALFYLWRVISMQMIINDEKCKIAELEREFQTYQATNIVVSKADIELLDKLQSNRIFWTKHLEAMAKYLPEAYWINRFGYKNQTFDVYGFGGITSQQEQLITLDKYLNTLRTEPVMKNVFSQIYFNSVARSDDASNQQVTFFFSAVKQGGQHAPQ